MKKRVYSIFLPVLSCAAIVGAGFSTWYFAELTNQLNNEDISVKITDARQAGNTFSLVSSDSTITFDQSAISYSENTYVVFGYIAEVEEDDNLTVTFQHGEEDTTAGADIFWALTEGAEDSSLINEVLISSTSSTVATFDYVDGENTYRLSYLVYTNATDQTDLKSDIEEAVQSLEFTNNLNEQVTLTDFAFSADDLTINELPALTYDAPTFDVYDRSDYETLKAKVSSNVLRFETFVDVSE